MAYTQQQQQRGGVIPAPQQPQRRPDPDPIDTGIASPLGKGNIFDLGNRFRIPGAPTKDSEVYRFTNGKTFNLAEVLSIISAEKLNLEGPKFALRKGTKLEGSDRYSYKGGALYEAEVRLCEAGLKVFIPERAEGEGNGQSQGQEQRGGEETGAKCHLGAIRLSNDGRKYLVGTLSVATSMRDTPITAQQVGVALDATKEGLDNGTPLNELLPNLPVVDFVSARGAQYQKAMTINTQTGFIEFHDLPGQSRSQGGNDRGVRGGGYYDRGARQTRGGDRQPPAASAADIGASDFDAGAGGEETDGEDFAHEEAAPAQVSSARRGGSRR